MGERSLPTKKDEFRVWKAQFLARIQANAGAWGLDAGDVANFAMVCADLDAKRAAQLSALAEAKAATEAEEAARSIVVQQVRSFARQLKANPGIEDADIVSLGLKPRDRTPTRATVPDAAPIGAIVRHARLTHVLRIRNAETPDSVAKPRGVVGCEVWRWIGPAAPPDIADYTYLGTAYKSRFEARAKSEDAGQTAWYRLRWITTRGETGTWSAEVVATILG
jgi:hypothetical protein